MPGNVNLDQLRIPFPSPKIIRADLPVCLCEDTFFYNNLEETCQLKDQSVTLSYISFGFCAIVQSAFSMGRPGISNA